jgi:hypothetical protein
MFNFTTEATLLLNVTHHIESRGMSLRRKDLQHEAFHFLTGKGFSPEDEMWLAQFELGFQFEDPGETKATEAGFLAATMWDATLVAVLKSW